jgi:class 3 adenylate cyclase
MTEVAVTLLFTDLVDSTAIGRSLEPAAAEALRQAHFSILRDAIGTTGGAEVKNLGDGLMVAFASPSRAIACAVAMQQGIERHNRRSEVALSIRIGLACGEAIEEDGDYFGDPVVEAARLCAAAAGDQILASDTVRVMAGRNRPAEMTPIGELELKGIPEPVATVEVEWAPAEHTGADTFPLPARLSAASPGGVFAFAGRAAELEQLDHIRKQTETGGLRIALISGEPGLGKTSLAAEASRRAHHAGGAVTFGACPESTGAPYQPWIAALSYVVSHAPDEVVDGLRPVHAAALRSLLPAVRDRIPVGEVVDADPDTERYLLLEAVIELLARMSNHQQLTVVLDDLHWADAATLGVLRHIVAASAPLRVAILATYRDSDITRGHPLTSLLAELRRQPTVTRLDLAGLDDVEIIELMEAAAGYELPPDGVDLAHALGRETAGNPFFTVELLRHLAETGALQPAAGGRYALATDIEQIALPSSVREVVADRVARVGDDVLDVLSVAAVIGQEFDLDLLARVTARTDDELLDVLERAAAAGLIGESADAAGCYRFVHALIVHTLANDLSATRRQRTHQRVAQALEDRGADAAAQATHWIAATQPTDMAKAIEAARRAGDDAYDALAPDDALRWYRQALELLDRQREPDQRVRGRLLLAVGRAAIAADEADYWASIMEAARIARTIGDDELLVAAALTRGQGGESVLAADPERLETIERALVVVGTGDSSERAQLLAALAEELDPHDWARRIPMSEEAVAIAQRLADDGDPRALISVSRALVVHALPDRIPQRRAELEATLAAAERVHDSVAVFDTRHAMHGLSLEDGDVIGAREHLAAARAIWESTGVPSMQYRLLVQECGLDLIAGRLSDVEADITAAFEVGAKAGHPTAMASLSAQISNLRMQQGRTGEAIGQLEPIAEAMPSLAVLRAALTLYYCDVGRLDDARRLFERDAANEFTDYPFDTAWLSSMHRMALAASVLGDAAAARVLFEKLHPYAGRVASSMVVLPGAVDLALGRLAATLDRHDEIDGYFAAALAVHERLDAAYLSALTQLDWAHALRSRARPGDLDRGAELTAAAATTAGVHGFAGLTRRAAANPSG